MKKLFFVVSIFVGVLALTACTPKVKNGVAYGLVHGHYVGEVQVEMKGKEIVEMSIEEYFLPYNAGQIAANTAWGESVPENVVEKVVTNAATGAVTKTYYAKFMLIDGKVYTGSLDEKNNIQYVNNNVNIEVFVKDAANAEAYVNAVKANKVFIIDSATATAKSTVLVVTGSAAVSMKKSEAGYWPQGDKYKLGWTGNMEAIVNALKETGVDVTYTKNAESKLWETEDFVSAATLTDFLDYQAVAKNAVANAK